RASACVSGDLSPLFSDSRAPRASRGTRFAQSTTNLMRKGEPMRTWSGATAALRVLLVVAIAAGCGKPAPVSTPAPGPAPAAQPIDITDGESLIRAMYERYQSKWYRTMTFVQTTTTTRPGTPPQIQTQPC